ncbi:TPA: hypothetical protein AB5C23_003434 [Vibrio cholerae]
MRDHYTATLMPSSKRVGYPQVTLPSKTLDDYTLFWGRNGNTKTANVLRAVNGKQGITTDEIRAFAKCSNVPDLVRAINKKLMNKGLMIIRIEPVCVAPNEAFHHWFLVKAPMMDVPVKMSVNDPIH